MALTSPLSSTPTLPLDEAPRLHYNHSAENIASLSTHLSHIASSSLPSTLVAHSSTPHSPAPATQIPALVFYPTCTQHVSSIVAACHERFVAVTSFGGGTSLGGALTCTRGGVSVDFGRMKSVDGVDEADGNVSVQAGVGWVELNEVLEGRGFWFPVDPAKGASIGGMIAMSCSGTNAYRYGTIKQHILSLTLVLADGTIIKTRNRPRKSSAGYDLGSLIIGSEGTLALVTEAILKITPLPQNLHVGLVTFESLQDGVDVALGVLRSGMQLEALELADRSCMYAINRSGLAASSSSSSSSSSPLVFEEKPTLFLKVAGSAQSVREQMEFVTKLCTQHGALHTEFTHEKARIEELWGARKCLGHALVAMKQSPSDLFLSTDAAVPVSALARLVRESEALVRTQGSPAWFTASVGHVGDGNVHTAIVCPQEAKEEAEDLLDKIRRLALELDGTITGEHGIGLKLRDLLSDEVGVQGVDLMRKIKFALDPRAILNPDKVVRLEVGV